jgi:hypothetical protein
MNIAPYTRGKGKPCLVLDVHKEPPGSIRKKKSALAEPAYDQCPPSNSFEKKLPTICTSREAGLILH